MLYKYIPIVSLPLNVQAYRVRFVEKELPKYKRMAISEYGYNPNSVTRGRYNQPGEHVLYTSTNPLTSYDETINSSLLNSYFYLSVWRKKDKKQNCNCFLSSFDSCSGDLTSNSGKLRSEYLEKLNEEERNVVRNIGENLEMKYLHDREDKYYESSQLASRIFKTADCIIAPSAKDSNEVNITFNKEFTDNSLCLERVYLCRPFDNQNKSMIFKVDKIGIVNDNKVVWYHWHVKAHSLRIRNPFSLNQDFHKIGMPILYPNVNKPIDDWHTGFYNQELVEFKIELEKDIN